MNICIGLFRYIATYCGHACFSNDIPVVIPGGKTAALDNTGAINDEHCLYFAIYQ